ncbi:MAG: outer membrane beta-barrel protein [Bacteroidales bacterium]
MKKVLMSLAFMFFIWASNAQYDAGKILMTGGLNFSSTTPKYEVKSGGSTTTTDGTKITLFGINLSGGYFIADNIAVGLGIGFENSKSTSESDNAKMTDTDNMLSVAPFARYYIPYSDQFAFFGQLTAGFGFGKSKDEVTSGSTTTTTETDNSMVMVGISPGFSFMMTEKVGLEMRYGFLGWSSYTSKTEGTGDDYAKLTTSTFGLNLDLNSLVFGISVLF